MIKTITQDATTYVCTLVRGDPKSMRSEKEPICYCQCLTRYGRIVTECCHVLSHAVLRADRAVWEADLDLTFLDYLDLPFDIILQDVDWSKIHFGFDHKHYVCRCSQLWSSWIRGFQRDTTWVNHELEAARCVYVFTQWNKHNVTSWTHYGPPTSAYTQHHMWCICVLVMIMRSSKLARV